MGTANKATAAKKKSPTQSGGTKQNSGKGETSHPGQGMTRHQQLGTGSPVKGTGLESAHLQATGACKP